MRVFTFFLKTDTFKKKLELCQFFHKEYFYSFGSKISYLCKSMCECVLFKDNGSTGWTFNLRSWTSYTASFSTAEQNMQDSYFPKYTKSQNHEQTCFQESFWLPSLWWGMTFRSVVCVLLFSRLRMTNAWEPDPSLCSHYNTRHSHFGGESVHVIVGRACLNAL